MIVQTTPDIKRSSAYCAPRGDEEMPIHMLIYAMSSIQFVNGTVTSVFGDYCSKHNSFGPGCACPTGAIVL